ncbi:L-arabinitol 4-dehydrogenase [Apophysomyces sp. BC1034]|nr:L-arabinitol 4-dehydrogenase [Apophysomyces sp. BC1015]KAG0177767.1 L-arabinitol 4-dehydrogenase [Apophysomyces sp. BC1021]KAG0187533.1 L-arabinitol 4-dehydrogenase [Apophysomyces sp. BC1034]
MSFEEGALIEPLSVAVHSVDRTPVREGSRVLVLGAGPIGLLVAAVAYAKGATHCTILDINASRLAFAKTYLPQIQTVQLSRPENQDDLLDWAQLQIARLELDTVMADVAFECTGAESCIALSMYAVRRGGVVMLIGLGNGRAMMPTDIITTREVDVRGNFRYANAHKKAIDLVGQDKIQLDRLVTHRFRLEDTIDAYETARKGGDGILKILIIGGVMDS